MLAAVYPSPWPTSFAMMGVGPGFVSFSQKTTRSMRVVLISIAVYLALVTVPLALVVLNSSPGHPKREQDPDNDFDFHSIIDITLPVRFLGVFVGKQATLIQPLSSPTSLSFRKGAC